MKQFIVILFLIINASLNAQVIYTLNIQDTSIYHLALDSSENADKIEAIKQFSSKNTLPQIVFEIDSQVDTVLSTSKMYVRIKPNTFEKKSW